MQEEPGSKSSGCSHCRSLLGISLQMLPWRGKAQVLSHPCCPRTPAMQSAPREPWGAPASGEGRGLACSC